MLWSSISFLTDHEVGSGYCAIGIRALAAKLNVIAFNSSSSFNDLHVFIEF